MKDHNQHQVLKRALLCSQHSPKESAPLLVNHRCMLSIILIKTNSDLVKGIVRPEFWHNLLTLMLLLTHMLFFSHTTTVYSDHHCAPFRIWLKMYFSLQINSWILTDEAGLRIAIWIWTLGIPNLNQLKLNDIHMTVILTTCWWLVWKFLKKKKVFTF